MNRKPITLLEESDFEKLRSHASRLEAQNALYQDQVRQYFIANTYIFEV